MAVTPDGRRAISSSVDNLKVWDLESGRALQTIEDHGSFVTDVAVTPDGRRAVCGSVDNLKVWDLQSGATLATFSCDASAMCCAVANDCTIVAGDSGGRVYFLAPES